MDFKPELKTEWITELKGAGLGARTDGWGPGPREGQDRGDSNFSLSSVLGNGLFLPRLTNRHVSGLSPYTLISSSVP